jgi:hypothetical protein
LKPGKLSEFFKDLIEVDENKESDHQIILEEADPIS